jgi:cbb3-type cytochrome oxidase subunit 3
VEAAAYGWVPGVMTVGFLVFFIAWTIWAYHPANRARLEAAGRLPFDDGDAK